MSRVRILYFTGCPNHEPAVDAVEAVVHELGLDLEIDQVEVHTGEDADRLRFLGSPTVQVDGVDVEPGAAERSDYSFTCRIYRYGDATHGVPRAAWIREALLGA